MSMGIRIIATRPMQEKDGTTRIECDTKVLKAFDTDNPKEMRSFDFLTGVIAGRKIEEAFDSNARDYAKNPHAASDVIVTMISNNYKSCSERYIEEKDGLYNWNPKPIQLTSPMLRKFITLLIEDRNSQGYPIPEDVEQELFNFIDSYEVFNLVFES